MQSKAFSLTTCEQVKKQFEISGRDETVLMYLGLLASCYERPVPKEVQQFYLQHLQELTDDQVITALDRAAKEEAKFFPSPARLLELAGVETPRCRSEREAKDALAWLFWLLRRHGIDGHPARGKQLVERGRDAEGVWHDARFEQIPAPAVPERTRKALDELGAGNVEAGAKLIWEHPLLGRGDPDAYPSLGLKLSAIEKLEARWLEAWRRSEP